MQSLSLQPTSEKNAPAPDLAREIAELETLLVERRRELDALQEEFREFKRRYTRIVGGPLAELAEVERAIKEAEQLALGIEAPAEDEETFDEGTVQNSATPVRVSLRKLFWSVAKLFHPDHATDESEALRRHHVMAEASRAYREGDVESLHTLLGDEQLQSYCATGHADEGEADLAIRLMYLKEELRTVEFGIKRIRQHGLYRQKLAFEEELRGGRDLLALEAERINRQIAKARRRLAHLS